MVESVFSSNSKSLVLINTAGNKTDILLTSGPSNREMEIGGGVVGGAAVSAGSGAAANKYVEDAEFHDNIDRVLSETDPPTHVNVSGKNLFEDNLIESNGLYLDRSTNVLYEYDPNNGVYIDRATGEEYWPIDSTSTPQSGSLPRDMSSEQLQEKPEGFSETSLYYQSTPVYEDYSQLTPPRDESSGQINSQVNTIQQNETTYTGDVQSVESQGVNGSDYVEELDEDSELFEVGIE